MEEAEAVAEAVREELAPRHLLGCAAAGVVAGVRELELGPGWPSGRVLPSVHAEGAVGALVSGLPVLTVVSQGCRPIGREAVITRCQGNFVYELAGKPALERLRREIRRQQSPQQSRIEFRGLVRPKRRSWDRFGNDAPP